MQPSSRRMRLGNNWRVEYSRVIELLTTLPDIATAMALASQPMQYWWRTLQHLPSKLNKNSLLRDLLRTIKIKSDRPCLGRNTVVTWPFHGHQGTWTHARTFHHPMSLCREQVPFHSFHRSWFQRSCHIFRKYRLPFLHSPLVTRLNKTRLFH